MTDKQDTIIVSGIQPSGEIHLGNWAGMLRQLVALQDRDAKRYYFIADLHAMTIEYDPSVFQDRVLDVAATLLALGVDPKKCTLFVQSHVPEHPELGWIFNTVTPVQEMMKMTQYKDKSAKKKNEKNINMGLLGYPVLQAADILMYGGNAVPVGEDQVQHVETTRVIAKNFNRRFGKTFPEPKTILNETSRLKSLTDPTKKMSKSDDPKGYIALDDDPETLREKLARVPTETTGIVSEERLETEDYAGVKLLFDILVLFGSTDEKARALGGEKVRYGDLKARAAEVISLHFNTYREEKKALIEDPDRIRKILDDGAKAASEVAKATMEDVRRKTGLRP